MNANPPRLPADAALLHQVQSLLTDPQHANNPLRETLAQLLAHTEAQRLRLERMVHIADGYYSISRQHNETLLEQYDRQLKRLEKLARISDRYQNSLRELSEALKDASLKDPLTHVGNRRFLIDRLHAETERARRKGLVYSIGLLDIDYFKAINDRYGHDAGDQTLCAIAQAIQTALRDYDVCGRWGGEEFLLLLPETDLELAVQIAERVHAAIRAIALAFMDTSVSASTGLACYQAGESYADTLNRADAALLRAKAQGRNRIDVG